MKSIGTVQPVSAGKSRKGFTVARHLILSLVGSFTFAWGFVAVCVAGLVALGVDFHEAEILMLLLAFLVFLSLFLWSFAASRPWRVTMFLYGSAALMTSAAWALQRSVLG